MGGDDDEAASAPVAAAAAPAPTSIVAKMQQLRKMQEQATGPRDDMSPTPPGTPVQGLPPPALPATVRQASPPQPAFMDDDEEERQLAAKLAAASKKQTAVAARLAEARRELAASSREESTAFVDSLAARAAEHAAAAVRAAAAEADSAAESEAMRQIAVLELQLEQYRIALEMEKLRGSESTDAVVKRLRKEQDDEMKVVDAQAAERQKAAIDRAVVEAEAQRKAELAAARRAADEAKIALRAKCEKEAAERLQAAVQKVQLEMDAKLAEAVGAFRTGSKSGLKEETRKLKEDFAARLEASKAAALTLAQEETRVQLDELRDEFDLERDALEEKHAAEMAARVVAATEHARLEAEQRHSEQRSALVAAQHAEATVIRQEVEAEHADKLTLQVQRAKWDLEDKAQEESKEMAEPRLLRERQARRAAEAELRRATTYLEGVQGALEEQKIKTEVRFQ